MFVDLTVPSLVGATDESCMRYGCHRDDRALRRKVGELVDHKLSNINERIKQRGVCESG